MIGIPCAFSSLFFGILPLTMCVSKTTTFDTCTEQPNRNPQSHPLPLITPIEEVAHVGSVLHVPGLW